MGNHWGEKTKYICQLIHRGKFCIACKSGNTRILVNEHYLNDYFLNFGEVRALTQYLKNEYFSVHQCMNCGLSYQDLVLEENEVSKIYSSENEAAIYDQVHNHSLHAYVHLTEEILLLRQINQAREITTLDFGCSWGRWSAMAQAFGCRVFGFEVDKVAASFAQNRGIEIIDWEDIRKLKFDFINIDQVLEHVPAPLDVLEKLKYSLKPDGMIKVSVPGDKNLPSLLLKNNLFNLDYKTLDALSPLQHVNLFTNKSLKVLGKRAGLEAMRIPIFKQFGAGQLWNMPRQLNRNLLTPFKRWFSTGTYVWFKLN